MQQVTCETCGLTYIKYNNSVDLDHKSFHNRFKYYERKYGTEFLIPANKLRDVEIYAYSLLRSANEVKQIQGAQHLLRMEFSKHLRVKRKAKSYERFVQKLLQEDWIQREFSHVKDYIQNHYKVSW